MKKESRPSGDRGNPTLRILLLLCFFLVGTQTTQADPLDVWHPAILPDPEVAPNLIYPIRTVSFGNGIFVAGGRIILTSTDGLSWTNRADVRPAATPSGLTRLVYGNGQFIGLANYQDVLASANGTNWAQRTIASPDAIYDLAFGNDTFVAVGDKGFAWTSQDGISWVRHKSGTNAQLASVSFAKDRFFALGASGLLLTSPDGETWTAQQVNTRNSLIDAAFGNGSYVVLGSASTALISQDGTTWSNSGVGPPAPARLIFANRYFMASASDGLWTSSDGLNWTRRDTGIAGNSANSVAFGKSIVVVAADSVPRLFYSDPLPVNPATDAAVLDLHQYAGITINGAVGVSYRIEYVDELAPTNSWKSLTTLQLPASPYLWIDSTSTNANRRVYRAVLPP